jgi:hypothetical protein
MAYAVFEEDERLTRIFATEQEAWNAAERAGLVDTAPDGKKVLDDHLEIRFCAGAPDKGEDMGADFKIY